MAKNVNTGIKFGTDGWRGIIADNFTFENVRIIAQAISEWVKKDLKKGKLKKKRIAVGYDTRFLSVEFAETLACVLAKNNIEVYLSDAAIPTPALSYAVVTSKSIAGIMITASHNPAKFNGVKIKTAQGGGAGTDITDLVEGYLHKTPVKMMDFEVAKKSKAIIMSDFQTKYIKFMRNYLDLAKVKKSTFKVLTDVMHGSGKELMREVLKGTKLRLSLMREDVNPSFDGGKPEPVVHYVGELMRRVKKEKFDIGLVLDGDADRIAAIAPGGIYIHPQKILGLLVLHLIRNRGRQGGVVKTICGTTMMDNIAKKLGVKLYETPVGFKYISELMITEQIVAGGEEAGGMGVQDYVPERDGTLAGLLLVEMMVYQKKNLKQLVDDMEKEFGRYYYQRCDLHLGEGKFDEKAIRSIKTLLGKKVVEVKDFDGIKLICEDGSWLMLRPSGTEPLVRAYSESKSLKRAKELIVIGEKLLRA